VDYFCGFFKKTFRGEREFYFYHDKSVCFCVSKAFLKKFENFLFFYLLQINMFLVFSNHFDVLMSKIIF